MTVLIREELNDADLAWAAADPAVGQLVRARQALAASGAPTCPRPSLERLPMLPSFLRERGAL